MTHPNPPILPDDATLENMLPHAYEAMKGVSDAIGIAYEHGLELDWKDGKPPLFHALKDMMATEAFQTWLSALMAQNDRALPEIPDGWHLARLKAEWKKSGGVRVYSAIILSDDGIITERGPTPRQAVLNAIAKIGEKDNG